MAYNVNKSNGDLLVVVEDGTADVTSTSITLLGKNYPGYGEFLNENLVRLMENFASSSAPNAPIEGQIWYDTASRTIKVWNGSLFTNAGAGLQLDTSSTAAHYVTFIANETGTEPYKIARNKSLTVQPSTGFVGINKNSAAGVRLEINNGTLVRTLQSSTHTGAGQVGLHMHGDDNKNNKILLDSYGAVASYIDFRKSRNTSAAPQAIGTNDTMGGFGAYGYNGTAYVEGGNLVFQAAENWTSSASGTRLMVRLAAPLGTSLTTKFTVYGNGDIEATGDVIGFSLSDERLKTKIERIEHALDKIEQLDGVYFNWNERALEIGKPSDQKEMGLLAGQVNQVAPEAVRPREDGYLGINYEKLFGLIVEGIKELRCEINSIKNAKVA